MPPITLRTLSKESLRIGSILLASYAVGAVANAISEIPLLVSAGEFVREGFVLAGTAVAVLYVLLRSVALTREIDVAENRLAASPVEFVREASVLAVPVVLWFALAGLSTTLRDLYILNAAIETVVLASTRAAILTAALYVLVRVVSVLAVAEDGGAGRVSTDDSAKGQHS